ncbi:MAG: SpoIIE family protein phosphatase [Candidatus Zixiibacteriota bacterium]|nr:MAG: SpoIIE family protein phosphatase [candidate division Zixibacteria bacterium]
MELRDFEHFRDLLLERRQMLSEWMNSGATLREQEVEAVRQLLNQIKDALGRIENHSFGDCDVCDGKVEPHRLEIQPISRVCIDCFSAEEKALLEEDLYLASKIHRALLPQSIPEIKGFELEVRSLAAGNIGGDYYDFLQGPNGDTMRIVIADAMGHGLPAGLLMSNLQGALRILSSDIDHPAPLITRLNKWICRNVPVTKFVSMACMCVHITGEDETRVTYANAWHVPPIVVRADGSHTALDATGTVLGVHEDFAYEEGSFTVSPGDYLVLYTDGVTEALNSKHEEFETDRLVEFVRSWQSGPFEGIVDSLMANVLEFSGSSQAADDLTAIILRKK